MLTISIVQSLLHVHVPFFFDCCSDAGIVLGVDEQERRAEVRQCKQKQEDDRGLVVQKVEQKCGRHGTFQIYEHPQNAHVAFHNAKL